MIYSLAIGVDNLFLPKLSFAFLSEKISFDDTDDRLVIQRDCDFCFRITSL